MSGPDRSQHVSSAQNPRLKLLRRLAMRRGRVREGAFCVEGEDLVLAGLQAGWRPRFVVADEAVPGDPSLVAALGGVEVVFARAELIAQVAGLAHPPRVLGVFDLPESPGLERGADGGAGAAAGAGLVAPIVFLDGVRDPGNVGTVVRSACAFGATAVALGAGCADPYGPKATRASMGAVFRVPLNLVPGVGDVVDGSATVVALDAGADVALHEVALTDASVLCIGGERAGLSDEVRARADVVVSIPQRPDVDSLNAGVAASIVLYEWQRQMLGAGGGEAGEGVAP